jgi:hypothetical protein
MKLPSRQYQNGMVNTGCAGLSRVYKEKAGLVRWFRGADMA